jgi:hypothetical protein
MSASRRSARIAARESNRAYSLRALNALADALQENLDLLDQVGAVKDGWITVMMNLMIHKEDKIQGPIMGMIILTSSSLPPFYKEDRKQLSLLAEAAKCTRALARTIRGGDHRPLDDLEKNTRGMLNTVQELLNRIA